MRDAEKEAFLKVAIDPESQQDPTRSFNSCFSGGSFMQLANGSIWNCQVAAHHSTLNAAFGWDMESKPADELPLAGVQAMAGAAECITASAVTSSLYSGLGDPPESPPRPITCPGFPP